MPELSAILADIGHPPPEAIGRALGVTPRTVRRWLQAGHAPRPAMLALFWVTRWGLSAVDAEAANRAALYFALAESRRRQVEALRRRLESAEARADSGAANASSYDPLAPFQARRLPTISGA
ncbi:MAG: hypothetical protein J0L58_16795 [Burkholderiales bacterium]|nr:hypothetical protein [Burkholderiales bacterium]